MKSPFPGMDPYLEQFWSEVHARMAVYLSDQLQPQMPPGLVVRIEAYTSVEEVDEEALRGVSVPDVHVVEKSSRGARRSAKGAVFAEPFVIPLKLSRTLRSVRILDITVGKRIVTAIEILSPVNKLSRAGRKQYEQRRRKLLRDPAVNLVEIDLLREGNPILLVPDSAMPYEYYYPYRITVLRSRKADYLEMYEAGFRKRLPVIPIPLRPKDTDVGLDMQALVDKCYAAGTGSLIDYRQQVRPRLDGPDADWVEALLRKKGLR